MPVPRSRPDAVRSSTSTVPPQVARWESRRVAPVGKRAYFEVSLTFVPELAHPAVNASAPKRAQYLFSLLMKSTSVVRLSVGDEFCNIHATASRASASRCRAHLAEQARSARAALADSQKWTTLRRSGRRCSRARWGVHR